MDVTLIGKFPRGTQSTQSPMPYSYVGPKWSNIIPKLGKIIKAYGPYALVHIFLYVALYRSVSSDGRVLKFRYKVVNVCMPESSVKAAVVARQVCKRGVVRAVD